MCRLLPKICIPNADKHRGQILCVWRRLSLGRPSTLILFIRRNLEKEEDRFVQVISGGAQESVLHTV